MVYEAGSKRDASYHGNGRVSKPEDQQALIHELEGYGLYNISLSGTTTSEVDYGERIYLKITGTYDDNILAFAGGISKVAHHPTTITIHRQTTAKQ